MEMIQMAHRTKSTRTRVVIQDSHQTLSLYYNRRGFKAEVFGTGNGCRVEIEEMHVMTGSSLGRKKKYIVPGRIKWSVIVSRYSDDTKNGTD